ncbi:MAG: hypothetical protein O7H40_03980, partial [Gammaproteobacteria bacterium]|nr:hypothetical protein [Gammaproteobacteria bacterium]
MTTRTAQRYIQAAEWAKGKNDIVSHLPPTTIYLLAAPSTPAEFTERVVADLDAGQVIDHAALQKEIRQRRGADDTLDTQPDYPTFRKKIGAP